MYSREYGKKYRAMRKIEDKERRENAPKDQERIDDDLGELRKQIKGRFQGIART